MNDGTNPLSDMTGDRTGGRAGDRLVAQVADPMAAPVSDDCADTVDLRLTDELIELITAERAAHELTEPAAVRHRPGPGRTGPSGGAGDLLDGLADWGPVGTDAGPFQLVPVRIERDLQLVTQWMNDPAVSAFWELAGPGAATVDHLRSQLDGDGRSVPCLGVLAGVPMSYWEVYRADLDPIARHYPARPHDTGIHFLIGKVADRGRGLGTLLLRAVADLVLDRRPCCDRVVGEPDLRNTPSTAAFLGAGFRLTGEAELPGKRAALMIRDRALRAVL